MSPQTALSAAKQIAALAQTQVSSGLKAKTTAPAMRATATIEATYRRMRFSIKRETPNASDQVQMLLSARLRIPLIRAARNVISRHLPVSLSQLGARPAAQFGWLSSCSCLARSTPLALREGVF